MISSQRNQWRKKRIDKLFELLHFFEFEADLEDSLQKDAFLTQRFAFAE